MYGELFREQVNSCVDGHGLDADFPSCTQAPELHSAPMQGLLQDGIPRRITKVLRAGARRRLDQYSSPRLSSEFGVGEARS